MRPRIFVHKCLYEHMFLILSGVYLGVKLMGPMVALCLTFWGAARLLSTVAAHTLLHSNQQCTRVLISPQPWRHLLLSTFLDYSHPSMCEMVYHCGFDLYSLNV